MFFGWTVILGARTWYYPLTEYSVDREGVRVGLLRRLFSSNGRILKLRSIDAFSDSWSFAFEAIPARLY
jgi:hypothetical protein